MAAGDNITVTPGAGATVSTEDVGASVEVQHVTNKPMALKTQVSGNVTYYGLALPGTTQATAAWRAFKVDQTSGMIITWADGNADYDNVATDLSTLTYS